MKYLVSVISGLLTLSATTVAHAEGYAALPYNTYRAPVTTTRWSTPVRTVSTPVQTRTTVRETVTPVVERTIERNTETVVKQIVERPVYIDRVVEKPVYRDRIVTKVVEKPVVVEKVIEKPVYIERPVAVQQPVYVQPRVTQVAAPIINYNTSYSNQYNRVNAAYKNNYNRYQYNSGYKPYTTSNYNYSTNYKPYYNSSYNSNNYNDHGNYYGAADYNNGDPWSYLNGGSRYRY